MCQKESWGAIFATTEAHSTLRDQPPRMHGPGLWMYEQKEQRVTPVRMVIIIIIFITIFTTIIISIFYQHYHYHHCRYLDPSHCRGPDISLLDNSPQTLVPRTIPPPNQDNSPPYRSKPNLKITYIRTCMH